MPEEILRYADAAMYDSQPMLKEEGARITPRVFLLNATPDPLGTLAADMRMYRGDPVYHLSEITDEQRKWAWEEVMKTVLNTPLEGITVKFMIEAVTRSFTHQMVRQRVGAYYVQESLRFAVKKGIAKETAWPPTIIDHSNLDPDLLHPGEEAADVWHQAILQIEEAYNRLIALGIPAEDARGLLPHAVTTRIIYTTNLRALFVEAGKRLCTQAQFEWRLVFMGIMQAMKKHSTFGDHLAHIESGDVTDDTWQWELIATPRPMSFAPVCYKEGKCGFMSELDRGCTIRPRVEAFAMNGIPSTDWHTERGDYLHPIDPEEWMLDSSAGYTTEDNRPK